MSVLVRLRRLLLIVAAACCAVAGADRPIARNLVYHVQPGEEAVVTLKGFSLDGAPLQLAITSLPRNGDLYQLSDVFSNYGYEPKRAATPITTVPTVVTGSKNRLVFVRAPFGGSPLNAKYAEFRYTMSNGVETSKEAIVVITASEALVTSTFDLDADGWTIVGNSGSSPSAPTSPTFQPISRGPQLSYYIYGVDKVIRPRIDAFGADGDDALLWYFNAPPKFLGNQWAAYGGSLDFVLFSAEGSFDYSNLNNGGRGHLVVLECATCDQNAGVTLAMPLSKAFAYDGSITQFRLPLLPDAGWFKDPKNILRPWTPPPACELVRVLSALTAVRVLGDFTRGHESVAIDSVQLRHGPSGLPTQCYS